MLAFNEQISEPEKNSATWQPGSGCSKLQALVYDIPPWRKVPESDTRSVRVQLSGTAPYSSSEGRWFESRQEGRENCLIQGQLSVLTLVSVSVPPPCYRSST